MTLFRKITVHRMGSATAVMAGGAAVIADARAAAAPKPRTSTRVGVRNGIRVVAFMGGDYNHNSIPMEINLREIFAEKKDWRITFVRSSKYFTPELIASADLLVTSRGAGTDPIAWSASGLADTLTEGGPVWTEENIRAITRGVRERGMGFLALHNTIMSRSREMEDFLDIAPVIANEMQPLWIRDLEKEHPVTKGIGRFLISLDEQFGVVIKSPETVTLFETTAVHDKRHAVGGWCLERGKGRVVGLLPGHGAWAYRTPEYREIIWRSAHWALRKEIPAFGKSKG